METVEKGAKDFKEKHQDSKRQETETAAINVVRKPVPNRARPSGREEGCTRCAGNGHNSWNCPYRGTQCHKCKRVGHLARACRSSGSKKETTHRVTEPQEQEYRLDYIGVLKGINTKRVWIEVELNGIPLKMELDTGASVSLVSKKTWREKLGSPLTKRKIVLRAYSGHRLHVIGETTVDVNAGSQRHKSLPLVVVEGEEAPLFGRNWLVQVDVAWDVLKNTFVQECKTHAIVASCSQGQSPPTGARGNPPALDELLKRYDVIFKQQLGKIKDLKATIRVQSEATPNFFKPRPVAYALRERVEQELERLVAIGVMEPISHSEWAAPIVPEIKNNGDVRMCGDFKVTVNQCLDIEQYPLSKIDDLYKRLPFGVGSAPALFQRAMDTILQGLPGVVCYQDDTLVTGKEIDEHLKNLERVFGRLKEFGLRLRLTKCKFLKESVEYLGHVISRNGICTSPKKIEVIQKAPIPLNVTELRSFLGIVNYYGKFIQSVADLCAPLNELLQKNAPWIWTATCMESFKQLKQALGSAEVLCHYNPSEEISLACDASAHGLGAVMSHHFKDGSERPISYASRTLSKAERNYSQIEKETLSIIFGLKKFHQYLYGRKFLLVTDHQPLVKIFGPKTGISSVVAGRLQRWALCLAGYQYDIVYKPTQKHGNADGLSRYPSTESEAIDGEEGGDRILALYGPQLAACPLTVEDIERGTMSDALLRQVLKFTKDGWNKTGRVDDQLRPYFNRREELSTEGNCLTWGNQSSDSPGDAATYLEGIASEPSRDRKNEIIGPVARPFFGKMWLIVVHARTKWPEVFQLNEATSGTTINDYFLTTFCDENGIRHVRVAPYHPSSNGEAERFVKTFKRAMGNEKDAVRRLQQFLFSCRNTPHSTTGVSPAELLVGRQLRGRLDLLRQQTCITNTSHCPNPEVKVQASQRRQKIAYDKHAKQREFTVGQAVWVKGQNHQQNWLPGVIVKQRNSVSYTVNVSEQLWHRHIDHLREREQDEAHVQGAEDAEYVPNRQPGSADDQDIITDENAPNLRHEQQPIHDATPQEDQATLPEHATVEKRRKSTREHRPPVRFHEEFGYNSYVIAVLQLKLAMVVLYTPLGQTSVNSRVRQGKTNQVCWKRKKVLSISLMLSRPVMDGMKWSLIASSSGWRSDDMSGAWRWSDQQLHHKPKRMPQILFQDKQRTPQKVLDKETESVKGEVETVFLGPVGKGVGFWMANITVCGQPLRFKIDTGADVTAISEEDYRKIKGKGKLAKPSNILRGPSNQPLPVAGLGNLGEPYEIKLKRNSKPVSLFAPKRVPIPLHKDGISTDPEKTSAISQMDQPNNVSELQRFMGMLNQLGKFSPNHASITQPLRQLLSTKCTWTWGPAQEESFKTAKAELTKPTNLSLAVLQLHQDGWKPVVYASRSLTETERCYAQIENSKHLDDLPPRVLQFRLRLMWFAFSIVHVPGIYMYTADALSRAPTGVLIDSCIEFQKEVESHIAAVTETLPATKRNLTNIALLKLLILRLEL
eukprot:Em0007g168a